METRRQQQQVGQDLTGDCGVLEQLQEDMHLPPVCALASYPAALSYAIAGLKQVQRG